jgi:hypothetical protein
MRIVKFITCAFVLLFTLFVTHEARAQTVSGYTSIDYDEDTNIVTAYSETDEDYDADTAYTAFVKLSVVDQDWNTMGFRSASDDGTYGFASVEIEFFGNPDKTYTATGMHRAYTTLWDYDYTFWPLYSVYYYDPYYFTMYEGQNITAPWYYSFLGSGPMSTRPTQPIILGATADQASVQTPSQKPGSLTVLTLQTLSTGSGSDNGCTSGSDYGIKIAVTYQVNGQNGQPLHNAKMEPQEKVTNATFNGSAIADPQPNWSDIGPSRNSQTSRFTNSNGQFVDAPYGACNNSGFTHTFQQDISILVGGKRYTVKTNSVSLSTSTSGQGSISNGTDIQKSRP